MMRCAKTHFDPGFPLPETFSFDSCLLFPNTTMKTKFLSLVVACTAVMAMVPARGAFHFWSIREVYSDTSGNLQFIELFDSFGGQSFTGGQQIQVTDGVTTHTFTVPSN